MHGHEPSGRTRHARHHPGRIQSAFKGRKVTTWSFCGKTSREVGTGFRGNTSYMGAHGRKKSWDFAFDHADANPRLKHRLMYVHDVQALWYARAEMVAVLSRLHGEARAVDLVRSVTPVFNGLLPKGLLESTRSAR